MVSITMDDSSSLEFFKMFANKNCNIAEDIFNVFICNTYDVYNIKEKGKGIYMKARILPST